MQVEQPEIAAELAHRPDAVAKTEAVTILVFYFPFVDYRVPPIAAVAGDPGAGIADGDDHAETCDEELADSRIIGSGIEAVVFQVPSVAFGDGTYDAEPPSGCVNGIGRCG